MLTIDQQITITEVLMILLGFAVTWWIYYGSENAELPGEATEPNPSIPEETFSPPGRTLE